MAEEETFEVVEGGGQKYGGRLPLWSDVTEIAFEVFSFRLPFGNAQKVAKYCRKGLIGIHALRDHAVRCRANGYDPLDALSSSSLEPIRRRKEPDA